MSDDLRIALLACKRILTKLQQLSDAPTARLRTDGVIDHMTGMDRLRTREHQPLGVKGAGPHGESRIPAGVSLHEDASGGEHAPSKRLSLWAHYSFRMNHAARAGDATKLLELATAATRDYEEYTGLRRPSQHEYHSGAVDELLRDYTGVSSAEAAVWLRAPEKWVRRQRMLAARDPDYGEPREQDGRTRRVVGMTRAGKSTREIGVACGLSHTQVQRVLEGA